MCLKRYASSPLSSLLSQHSRLRFRGIVQRCCGVLGKTALMISFGPCSLLVQIRPIFHTHICVTPEYLNSGHFLWACWRSLVAQGVCLLRQLALHRTLRSPHFACDGSSCVRNRRRLSGNMPLESERAFARHLRGDSKVSARRSHTST